MALRLAVVALSLAAAGAADIVSGEPGAVPGIAAPRLPQTRIVGGVALADAITRWPYYVFVQARQKDGSTASCGGTLVSPTAVLTAAHCVAGTTGGAVFLGLRNASSYAQAVVFGAGAAVPHPLYSTGFNDIAVIKLATPARSVFPPVPLEPGSRDLTGASGIALGYGYTKPLGLNDDPTRDGFPTKLQSARLPLVDPMLCEQRWGALFDRRQHLCSGSWTAQADACVGDSGGPLLVGAAGADAWDAGSLAGVVSFGAGCAQYGTYSVYTRVSNYVTWIRGVAADVRAPSAAALPAVEYNPEAGSQQCSYASFSPAAFVPRPQTVLSCGAFPIATVDAADFTKTAVPCNGTAVVGSRMAATCPNVLSKLRQQCVGLAVCDSPIFDRCTGAAALAVKFTCGSALARAAAGRRALAV